ncbi:MAG: DUF3159 domain-containing protein [Bifidobacteriaceae bacterium]|jgi:hypothetical protein|nr:DUF3159 domain-containing protein [Bifidobacteriaceae bacterium]
MSGDEREPAAGPAPAAQAAQAAPSTGLRALVADEFNFSQAMGGPRGMAESVLPGLAFVVVYVITTELWPALIASAGLALLFAIVRLIQRGSVMGAISGLGGIGLGALWAWRTGKPEDVYAWGLWVNGAYLAGCLLSVLLRWPAVGIVVGFFGGGLEPKALSDWRADKAFARRAAWATWLLVALFGARLAVQLPLYYTEHVALLGSFKLIMGVPLFAAVLWLDWLIMRPVAKRPRSAEPAADQSHPESQ